MSIIQDRPIARLIGALQPCVADIGARGGFDEDMLAIAWACTVVAFEPEPEEATRLANSGDSRWKKVIVLPVAVGGTTGSSVLYVPESKEGASLLRHNPDMVELFGQENLHIVREEIPVNTVSLDDLLEGGQVRRIDFLKIDIEGAELDVLKAGRSVLADCVALKVECSFLPQRVSQPLVWDVIPFLLDEQFVVVDIHDIHRWRRRPTPCHPYRTNYEMPYSRGQLAQCDLVLLKSPSALTSQRQMLMLIVVASVLGYFDYAITVLRMNHQLVDIVKNEHGLDLESELKCWAAKSGTRELKRAIASRLRVLIPLVRSLTGWLPYRKPVTPY